MDPAHGSSDTFCTCNRLDSSNQVDGLLVFLSLQRSADPMNRHALVDVFLSWPELNSDDFLEIEDGIVFLSPGRGNASTTNAGDLCPNSDVVRTQLRRGDLRGLQP
jgi:hypothetical protein